VKDPVNQRGLTVVNVCNDRYIPDFHIIIKKTRQGLALSVKFCAKVIIKSGGDK
jgi:hypothetical protein